MALSVDAMLCHSERSEESPTRLHAINVIARSDSDVAIYLWLLSASRGFFADAQNDIQTDVKEIKEVREINDLRYQPSLSSLNSLNSLKLNERTGVRGVQNVQHVQHVQSVQSVQTCSVCSAWTKNK
jgi:hypothetical protein